MNKVVMVATLATLLAGCTTSRSFEPFLTIEREPEPVVIQEQSLIIINGVVYHFQPVQTTPPLPPRRPTNLTR